MNTSNSIYSHRNSKIIKIKRRLPDFKDSDEDYRLEKEGDVSDYLKPIPSIKTGPRYLNGKLVPYSIIGPLSLFTNKLNQNLTKTDLKKHSFSSNRVLHRQSTIINKIDYQSRFNDIMSKINEAKNKAIIEEKQKNSIFKEQSASNLTPFSLKS
jgi:hypothetical protein